MTMPDYLLSWFKPYRRLCGGIWKNVMILSSGNPFPKSRSKWVRANWQSNKKYWIKTIEAYGEENFGKSLNIHRAFNYIWSAKKSIFNYL